MQPSLLYPFPPIDSHRDVIHINAAILFMMANHGALFDRGVSSDHGVLVDHGVLFDYGVLF